MAEERAEDEVVDEAWLCGAFGPLYRCTLPAEHDGDHEAEDQRWERRADG